MLEVNPKRIGIIGHGLGGADILQRDRYGAQKRNAELGLDIDPAP